MIVNETNDLLDYKLKIIQNKDYFKFSIDSIILAEFVEINISDKKLLDLCTGNAPIPLILASKINEIVAIELQSEIYKLAQESVDINNIKNILVINDNIKNCTKHFPNNSFDIVTCNPPYFKYLETSLINFNKVKSIARHEIEISLEEIIKIAYNNLRAKGKFYLIHRTSRLTEIIYLLESIGFGIKKMQMVFYNQNSDCSMFAIEAKKDSTSDVKIIKPLFINDDGRFS